MKKHRGELLRKGIYESGYPITKLAKKWEKAENGFIYCLKKVTLA